MCLPTRQNGVENRDKVYSPGILEWSRYEVCLQQKQNKAC